MSVYFLFQLNIKIRTNRKLINYIETNPFFLSEEKEEEEEKKKV
ncbi:hypothetical protein E2C01_087381 [Portunus trituberculatus]|uniref:Uncharacterized protein n=1 Tax=Portunus trituberculatus TaxID=210409 RepID=A0A5B7J368_PORTR|nr:hypothetical protein [Portunus trituberculatus]